MSGKILKKDESIGILKNRKKNELIQVQQNHDLGRID
jgi:hypothetical protein